jgi:glycosyltransferase involved in cell wall biosynthesis
MLLGTPVISTRHGGPLDIIDEGVNGYFYEPRDYKQLSELVIRLLQNEHMMASMSKAASIKVFKTYDIKVIMSEIQTIYDNLM